MASRLTSQLTRLPPSTLLQTSLRLTPTHPTRTCLPPIRTLTLTHPLLKPKPPSTPPKPNPKLNPYKPSTIKPPSSQTATPTVDPSLVAKQDKHRRIGLIGAMFLGMAAAFYTLPFAFEYFNPTEKKKPNAILPAGCCAPTGRPVGMDITRAPHATPRERRDAAEEFDRGQNFPEWLMGITAVRKTLGVEAEGDVLELAVGTGRNLGFYVWEGVLKEGGEGMRSYTGVDISGDMVGVARDRLRDAVPGLAKVMRRRRAEGMPEEGLAVEVCNGKVRLFVGDAEGELPAPPGVEGDAEGRYDTVIQTFGLCSVAEPKRLLENAARAVKPDTGRIILVEHGRGTWEWFNEWFVDRSAQGHFDTYGCWWNRDIEAAVREAEKTVPGLEVVALKRPGLLQFGTLFLIELRVNSKKIPGGRVTGEKAGKPQAAKGSEEPKRSNWWFGSQ